MKKVKLRDVELGNGDSRIIVPVTGATEEEIMAETGRLNGTVCDLVEWRADLCGFCHDAEAVIETGRKLQTALGSLPLIFTVRTRGDGGRFDGTVEEYEALLGSVIAGGFCDACDIELNRGEKLVKRLTSLACVSGTGSIVSYHSFDRTPSVDGMVRLLCQMQSLGADIAKLAVMPKSIQDVLGLMMASARAAEAMDIPLITMSMGQLGSFSRVAGGLTGSCATFGSFGQESAPGQYDCRTLRKIMNLLQQK